MSATPTRPASFDARVTKYLPGLKTLARKYARTPEDRDDLVTDTIIAALTNWQSFRPDGGFWNWLTWQMRSVNSTRYSAQTAGKRAGLTLSLDDSFMLPIPAAQEVQTDARSIVQALSETRNGQITIAHAMGHTLEALGQQHGRSKERIRQIVETVRHDLEAGR